MEGIAEQLRSTLPALPPVQGDRGDKIIVDSADPEAFWSTLLDAIERDGTVLLMDPSWPKPWRDEASNVLAGFTTGAGPAILIPTSGSSGMPKFCIHNLDTLIHAAKAFNKQFNDRGWINSINVLPQHHVGGLMPVLRSAIASGKTLFTDYRVIMDGMTLPYDPASTSISLVPTQLKRLLESQTAIDFLQHLGIILLGGAACPDFLLQKCRSHGIPIAPCYGSTETAALVTIMDPVEFLAGKRGVGHPLPGTRIDLDQHGRILVESDAICIDRLPTDGTFRRHPFLTGDIGTITPDGSLEIKGRADRVIISGGEKIHPEQVESAAISSGRVLDALCHGEDDPEWGKRIELDIIPLENPRSLKSSLRKHLEASLPRYALPKNINIVERIESSSMRKRSMQGD